MARKSCTFGNPKEAVFPLLTKILDANTDLSVQVHPNDEYAKVHENGELGKTECWYIIDCAPGAELIYGHKAASREEFATWAKTANGINCFVKWQLNQVNFIMFQAVQFMR